MGSASVPLLLHGLGRISDKPFSDEVGSYQARYTSSFTLCSGRNFSRKVLVDRIECVERARLDFENSSTLAIMTEIDQTTVLFPLVLLLRCSLSFSV